MNKMVKLSHKKRRLKGGQKTVLLEAPSSSACIVAAPVFDYGSSSYTYNDAHWHETITHALLLK